jgi:hypothetical protein
VGDGLTDWERNFNINERDALRPRHLPWRTRGGQLRRLYPLRLQFSWSGKSFIAVQDEVDCIRQEFVFHMPWTTGEDGKLYYQANLKWNKFKAGSHRIGTRDVLRNKPGEETVPALGSTGRIVVPERAHIRPFPKSEYKSLAQKSERGSLPRFFRHTYLPPMWEESLEKIKKRAAEHTDHVSQVLDRLDQSQPTPPLDPNLYRCEVLQLVTQRIHELVRGAEHVSNPDNWPTAQGILEIQLTGFLYRDITALEWFTRLSPFDLTISSSWRPPEHNETVPKGIANSDHQRGDGMDLKPKGSGPASRNPLAMLCLHHAAQELVETKKIRVCYLELGGTNYLTNWPDPDLTIKEDVPIYEVKRANDKVGYSFNSTGYLPEGLGRMSQNLPKAFRSRLNKVKVNQLSLSWPDPPPTYLEMYIFALSNASHVHFTWKS